MPRIMAAVVLVTALIAHASSGLHAQSPVFVSVVPRTEMGLFGGLWSANADDAVGVGIRLTMNRSEWFGLEGSVEHKRAGAYAPREGIVLLNGRLLMPADPLRPTQLFLTAGFGGGTGVSRVFFPMVGIGVQTIGTIPIALRVELQRFPGGEMHAGRKARLLFSVVAVLR